MSSLEATPAPVHVVFLLEARDAREAGWLQHWLGQGAWRQGLPPSLAGTEPDWQVRRLGREPVLPDEGEVWLVPVRMVWLPSDRRGVGGLWDDLRHGRVIAPGPLRRLWIRHYRPQRMRPVIGEGAWLATLREAYDAHPSTFGRGSFAGFVRTRARLALEIAERMQRGPRYRFPQLLPADLFAGRHYARRLEEIAGQTGESHQAVHDRARQNMVEMAASQTPFMLDLIVALYRAGVRARHDGGIVADQAQLAALARRLRNEPEIFVISHNSMLDTVAFSLMLYDAGLPVPLTFGGINLRTPGVGWLAKRAGIIFLRRQFQDERASFAGLAGNVNIPAVFLENLLTDGQPQAGSAHPFAGLEGGENFLQIRFGDPLAVISHDDTNATFVGQIFDEHLDLAILALITGIDGIGHNIEHRMVDRFGVERQAGQVRVGSCDQLHAQFGRATVHQFDDVGDDLIHVGRRGFRFPFLTESKHIQHQA